MEGNISVEVIEKIESMGVAAAGAAGKVSILELPDEPDHVYAIVKPDGTLDFRKAEPSPVSHTLASVEETILFVREQGNKDKTLVWFDRGGVVIVLDKDTRRDVASLKLKMTPQCLRLLKIEKDNEKFEQAAFRRLLKIDLADCRTDDVLLNWVSDMQWDHEGASRGALSHGKVSIGKSVERQVQSAQGDCPEEIALKVRIFDDPSLKEEHGIKCAIELDNAIEKFCLVPLPLQLQDAIEMEIYVLGQKLREALECKVYRGTP